MITTIDPRLTDMGLPQYPPLPGNVDPLRIEEIRRTVYVGNLDPTVTPEQVLNFFTQVCDQNTSQFLFLQRMLLQRSMLWSDRCNSFTRARELLLVKTSFVQNCFQNKESLCRAKIERKEKQYFPGWRDQVCADGRRGLRSNPLSFHRVHGANFCSHSLHLQQPHVCRETPQVSIALAFCPTQEVKQPWSSTVRGGRPEALFTKMQHIVANGSVHTAQQHTSSIKESCVKNCLQISLRI